MCVWDSLVARVFLIDFVVGWRHFRGEGEGGVGRLGGRIKGRRGEEGVVCTYISRY